MTSSSVGRSARSRDSMRSTSSDSGAGHPGAATVSGVNVWVMIALSTCPEPAPSVGLLPAMHS